MLQTTLCYIERADSYLMLHRVSKKNDANHDKWIGVGGKLEWGESPEECLLREVREETGLELASYTYRGLLTFLYDDKEPEYIFTYTAAAQFSDADTEAASFAACDEGHLAWVKKTDIPSLSLWEGDQLMFRLLAEAHSQPFSLKLVYKKDVLTEAYECSDGIKRLL